MRDFSSIDREFSNSYGLLSNSQSLTVFSLLLLESSCNRESFSNGYDSSEISKSLEFSFKNNYESIYSSCLDEKKSFDNSKSSISFFLKSDSYESSEKIILPPVEEYKIVTIDMDIINETTQTFNSDKQNILILSFSKLLDIEESNILIKQITDTIYDNILKKPLKIEILSISGVNVILDFKVDFVSVDGVSDNIVYIFNSGLLENELSNNGLPIQTTLNDLYIDELPILITDDDNLIIPEPPNDDNSNDNSNDNYNNMLIGSIVGSFAGVLLILLFYYYSKKNKLKINPINQIVRFSSNNKISKIIKPYYKKNDKNDKNDKKDETLINSFDTKIVP